MVTGASGSLTLRSRGVGASTSTDVHIRSRRDGYVHQYGTIARRFETASLACRLRAMSHVTAVYHGPRRHRPRRVFPSGILNSRPPRGVRLRASSAAHQNRPWPSSLKTNRQLNSNEWSRDEVGRGGDDGGTERTDEWDCGVAPRRKRKRKD